MVSKSKKPPPPPFNLYHGVPAGWRVEEIIVRYKTLHGPLEKLTIDDISPVQSQWTQGQNLWVGYANALVFIGDGIVRNDHACVELAIDYIILDHFGSGSGYAPSRFARRLKHAQLDKQQKARLCAHFERLCQSRTRRYEFRHYRMLWQRIVPPDEWLSLTTIYPFLDTQSAAYLEYSRRGR